MTDEELKQIEKEFHEWGERIDCSCGKVAMHIPTLIAEIRSLRVELQNICKAMNIETHFGNIAGFIRVLRSERDRSLELAAKLQMQQKSENAE